MRNWGYCMLFAGWAAVGWAADTVPVITQTPAPTSGYVVNGSTQPGAVLTPANGLNVVPGNNLGARGNVNPAVTNPGAKAETGPRVGRAASTSANPGAPAAPAAPASAGVESKKPEFVVYGSENSAPQSGGGYGVVHTAPTPTQGKTSAAAAWPKEWAPTAHCAIEAGKAATVTGADYVRSVEIVDGSAEVTLVNGGKSPVRPLFEVRLLDSAGTTVGRVREHGAGSVLAPGATRVVTSRLQGDAKAVVSAEAMVAAPKDGAAGE